MRGRQFAKLAAAPLALGNEHAGAKAAAINGDIGGRQAFAYPFGYIRGLVRAVQA